MHAHAMAARQCLIERPSFIIPGLIRQQLGVDDASMERRFERQMPTITHDWPVR